MKKMIIVLLTVAIVLIGGYGMLFADAKGQELLPENLTVVETPELMESMKHEKFKKEEYVSILPEGVNIAPDGKISSSGFEGSYTERKAVDGKTDGNSYWEGNGNAYPNELTVTFGETHYIHAIRVALNPQNIWGKRMQTFAVFVTDGNGEQQTLLPESVYEFNPDCGNEVILEFETAAVTSVTLEFSANTGASGGQVAEFEIYE